MKFISYKKITTIMLVFGLAITAVSFLFERNHPTEANLFNDARADTSFVVGTGFTTVAFPGIPALTGSQATPAVAAFDFQSDHKIVAIGNFTGYQGNPSRGIVRINEDGSYDPTFVTGFGIYRGSSCCVQLDVRAVKVLSSGKILVVGGFDQYNGVTTPRGIVLLNPDGSIDTTFSTNAGTGIEDPIPAFNNEAINQIYINNDGSILLLGHIGYYNGVSKNGIVKINQDGTLDNTFTLPALIPSNTGIRLVTRFSDGDYLISHTQSTPVTIGGNSFGRLERINADGSIDTDSTYNTNIDSIPINNTVFNGIQLIDESVILVGNFSDSNHPAILKLNPDGTENTQFSINSGSGFNDNTSFIFNQVNNTVLILGAFTQFNGNAHSRIARINTNGSIDTTFNAGSGFVNPLISTTTYFGSEDNKGRIVVSGDFTQYRGDSYPGIVRLASTPVVTLTTPTTNPSGPFTVTMCVSDSVTGFTQSDITISNPTQNSLSGFSGPNPVSTTVCPSGEQYTVIVTPTAPTNETITITVPEGSMTNSFGFGNDASNTLTIIIHPLSHLLWLLFMDRSDQHQQDPVPLLVRVPPPQEQ